MTTMNLQIQGFHPSQFLRSRPCTKWANLKSFPSPHIFSSTSSIASLKYRLCLSAHPLLVKRKRRIVLPFKCYPQNCVADSRYSSSRFSQATFQLSDAQTEREETTIGSFDTQSDLCFASQERENFKGESLMIQKVFRKWQIMLPTQSSSPKIGEAIDKKPIQTVVSDCKEVTASARAMKFLQASFMYFLKLDASISLPVVIFIPWFLTISAVYGAEVTKELTPLWVIGPLVLSLYIKIIKGLCSLYVFCFIQSVKLVKNLPEFLHRCKGQLHSILQAYLIKPFSDIKSSDKKELFRHTSKLLEGWVIEKYLDFIESVWPYYCRIIRFLKKANLI